MTVNSHRIPSIFNEIFKIDIFSQLYESHRGRPHKRLCAVLAKADEIFLIFRPKYRNCGTWMSRKARH